MNNIIKYLLFLMSLVLILTACNDEKELPINPEAGEQLVKNSCEGCHTDYELLKEVHTPDPPSTGGGGCGGDAPHYEPYDRVVMQGSGYEDFKKSVHGNLGCVACHNGVENADNKDHAHSGDFISSPSLYAGDKCASCHPDVVARTTNSTHEQGWGQKSMVSLRFGTGTGPEAFDALPEQLKDGYKDNCQRCHGTCADCHITRPSAGGGGLANNHKFMMPDMRKNCTTCHVSRGGHAYFGEGIGTVPDVHLTGAGFKCLDCHTKNEIHGDGNYYDQRYKTQLAPECSDCHSDIGSSNDFHTVHLDAFNCQTCHSQDYNNCGSCHIHEEGARIPAHLKFKIGMNPIPETKPYRIATLRQSLMAPDSWSHYGVDELANFDIRPTYKYTTPHNIVRWTARTDTSAITINDESSHPACSQACHILEDVDPDDPDGRRYNMKYYLFDSDLVEDWEKSATSKLTVDGKLPAWWQVN